LDVHRVFTRSELHASAAFERVVRLDFLLGELLVVAAAVAYARYGPRLARASQADRISTGLVLGVIGLAVQWAASLAAELIGVWWARRHGLIHLGYADAIFENWLGLGGALLALVGLWVVMLTHRRIGERWWLVAAPLFAALSALLALATPSLLPGLHPLRDPRLAATAARLEQQEGVGRIPVRVQSVH